MKLAKSLMVVTLAFCVGVFSCRSRRSRWHTSRGSTGRMATMRAEYWFPSALIALDVAAALPYAWQGCWRMMIYWLAAATLTACVTFTGGQA